MSDYAANRERLLTAAGMSGFDVYREDSAKLFLWKLTDGATIRLHLLQRDRAAFGSATICDLPDDRAGELQVMLSNYESPERLQLRVYDRAGYRSNTVALGYRFDSFDPRSLVHHLGLFAQHIVELKQDLGISDAALLGSWIKANMHDLGGDPAA